LVRFHVHLEEKVLTIFGKVLDPESRPLRKTPLICSMTLEFDGHSSSAETKVRTGENGEMEVSFAHSLPGLKALVLDLRPPGDYPSMAAGIRVSRGLGLRKIDLGKIQLRWKPILASGKVVDTRGRPLPRCDVFGEPGDGDEAWTKTGEGGGFVLRVVTKRRKFLLRVFRKGWIQKSSPVVSTGASGVTIILEKAGSVSGSLLLKKNIFPGKFVVCLGMEMEKETSRFWELPGQSTMESTRNLEDGRVWKEIGILPAQDGSFRFPTVPTGLASLRIRSSSNEKILLKVPGILVLPGKENKDPRIQNIDLRHIDTGK